MVTTITRLVLSPYSAGGAPSITSMDCTASTGIWLENTLLCWSVMGWPSTEKEFDAWSPRPWNRPLESAETPGDASVTSELSDEDWLSSGSLSNNCRSTSVWVVGSVSTRSAPASTVTDVFACPMTRLNFSSVGTADRTSTSWFLTWKPSALALT